MLSETRTTEEMNENELKVPNYILIRCDAYNRHTGGVAIYVHTSVKAHEIIKHCVNNIWALAVKINKGLVNDVFAVVYKGHNATDAEFLTFMEEYLENLSEKDININIVGDFNIDLT